MKLKRQNSLISFLGRTSVLALRIMAFEVISFMLSFLRWARQRQARSQILPALPITSFVFLNAIAIRIWIDSFRYSYKSHLSYTKTNLSHRNFLANLRRMREWRVVALPYLLVLTPRPSLDRQPLTIPSVVFLFYGNLYYNF